MVKAPEPTSKINAPAEVGEAEDGKAKQEAKAKLPDTSDNGPKPENEEKAFTEEQDAQLIKMKQENKSWKEIAAEMGKPQWLLKQRFKEIKPKDEKGGQKEEKSKGKDKAVEKQASIHDGKHIAHHSEKTKVKKADNKEASKAQDIHKGKTKAKYTRSEWMTLTEDDSFTYKDLETLAGIVSQDNDEKWDRISSRFFDYTGRRVHPEDIKRKLT